MEDIEISLIDGVAPTTKCEKNFEKQQGNILKLKKGLVDRKIKKGEKVFLLGCYLNVYSNLAEVYVSKGENLKTGDLVGLPDSRILNFQIWYLNKKLNPQKWLRI